MGKKTGKSGGAVKKGDTMRKAGKVPPARPWGVSPPPPPKPPPPPPPKPPPPPPKPKSGGKN